MIVVDSSAIVTLLVDDSSLGARVRAEHLQVPLITVDHKLTGIPGAHADVRVIEAA